MQYLFVGFMVLLISGVGGGVSSEKAREYNIADGETTKVAPLAGWSITELGYLPMKGVKLEYRPNDKKHSKILLDIYPAAATRKPIDTPDQLKELMAESSKNNISQSVEKTANFRKLPDGACGFGFAIELTDASMVGKKNTDPEQYLIMTNYFVRASQGFVITTLFHDAKNDSFVKDVDTYLTSGICAKKDAGAPVKGK